MFKFASLLLLCAVCIEPAFAQDDAKNPPHFAVRRGFVFTATARGVFRCRGHHNGTSNRSQNVSDVSSRSGLR